MSKPNKTITKKRTKEAVPHGLVGKLILPGDTGNIEYIPDFLSPDATAALMNTVRDMRSWKRRTIHMYGREIEQTRDTAFFGTHSFTYSGQAEESPTGWDNDAPASTELKQLARKVEDHLNLPQDFFNVLLANKYAHGGEHVGWHSDGLACFGDEPIIASVSIGFTRKFVVRTKKDKKSVYHYELKNGSLLVMSGKMQQYYHHCIPKVSRNKCDEVRLNFTFRRVVETQEDV